MSWFYYYKRLYFLCQKENHCQNIHTQCHKLKIMNKYSILFNHLFTSCFNHKFMCLFNSNHTQLHRYQRSDQQNQGKPYIFLCLRCIIPPFLSCKHSDQRTTEAKCEKCYVKYKKNTSIFFPFYSPHNIIYENN